MWDITIRSFGRVQKPLTNCEAAPKSKRKSIQFVVNPTEQHDGIMFLTHMPSAEQTQNWDKKNGSCQTILERWYTDNKYRRSLSERRLDRRTNQTIRRTCLGRPFLRSCIWRKATMGEELAVWLHGWIPSDFFKRQSRLHEFVSRICVDRGRNLEKKRHSACWSGRILKIWTRPKSIFESSMQKKCQRHTGANILYYQSQMEQQNCLEDTTESENPLQRGKNLKGVKISGKNFKSTRRGLNRQKQKMTTLEPEMTSDQSKVISFYRHQNELRVELHVPIEETFPNPLKYIDVTRTTYTNLDVIQESRVDNYWNVDVDRIVSDLIFVAWKLVKHVKSMSKACQKQRKRRRSRNGLLKSQRSTTLEDCETFFLSIRKMECAKKPLKKR